MTFLWLLNFCSDAFIPHLPQYLIISLGDIYSNFSQVLPMIHDLLKVHQNIFRPVGNWISYRFFREKDECKYFKLKTKFGFGRK